MIDGIPSRPLYFYHKDMIVNDVISRDTIRCNETWLAGKWTMKIWVKTSIQFVAMFDYRRVELHSLSMTSHHGMSGEL